MVGRVIRTPVCEEEVAALNPVHTTESDTDATSQAAGTAAPPPQDGRGAAFLAEGRVLLDRACTGDNRERGQAAVMTDELLDRMRHALGDGALDPSSYARVLRASALVRNMARLPELPPDPLVNELVSHTVTHGLAAHNAAAQALRGTLAMSRGSFDEALDAAVDAMVTIERVGADGDSSVERALAMNDTASLLDQLGLPDVAAGMFADSAAEFGRLGMTAYRVMTVGDQVRSELLHGLWLERIGQAAAAVGRFELAATLSRTALTDAQQASPPLELDEEFLAVFHAAVALADPGPDHEQTLRKACPRIALPGQMVATLALVRLLAADGRRAEADATLAELRADCRRFQLGLPLRLALARGVLELPTRDGDEPDRAALGYLAEVEDELWAGREARVRALRTRLEHERLRRGRGPLRMITAKDPVTRLPDRSVLDDLLSRPAAPEQLPAALAMVDIDHLVEINERGSYADGDAALRAVAVTVRAAVRPDDAVLRYSDDEFVVLMPNRTLEEAAEAMRRVASSVTTLPFDRGHGATVSIGVVAISPDEVGESTLIRADEATSHAKSRGGNQVAVLSATPAPR